LLELRGHTDLIVALAYSLDGRLLASASADGSARLWDAASGRLLTTVRSPSDRAQCVAFSPDGALFAVGYQRPYGYVQIWETSPWRRREQWAAHAEATRGVAFARGGRQLITGGNDSAPRFWDAESFAELESAGRSGVSVSALALRPDGGALAALTVKPAALHIWELAAHTTRFRRFLPSLAGYAVGYSPDGSLLACGLEKDVALITPAERKAAPAHWPAHDGSVLAVAFRRDGGALLSAGADGFVRQWSLDGRMLRETDWQIGELGSLAVSPDGLTAAVGGAERIMIWDLEG
jgi:WD40 repeat protein